MLSRVQPYSVSSVAPQYYRGNVLLSIYLAAFPLLISLAGLALLGPGRLLVRMQVISYIGALLLLGLQWFRQKHYLEDIGWGFLLLGNIIWFAAAAFIHAVTPNLWFGDWIDENVSDEALVLAGILIQVFLLSNVLGYALGRWKKRSTGIVEIPTDSIISAKYRPLMVVAFFLIGLIPYILFSGGLESALAGILSGRADKPWAIAAGSSYEGNALQTVFWLTRAFLVCAGSLAGVYLLWDKSRTLPRTAVYLLIFVLSGLVVYFDQGTRSIFAMAMVPVFVLAVLKSAKTRSEFSRTRLVLVGVLASLALLTMTQVQLFYRLDRSRSDLIDLPLSEIIQPKQQIDFYTETAIATVVRDTVLRDDLHESPLAMFVVNVIPRVLWSDKPLPYTLWYYTLYRWGVDIWVNGGNALPSVVGQYYMDWGFLGVLWAGILFGLAAAWLTRLIQGRCYGIEQVIFVFSGLTFLLVSYRFLSPGYHYPTLILGLLVLLLVRRKRTQLDSM